MKLFPAIDLLQGEVVRLRKGEFHDETRYNKDPIALALSFQESGAEWIHLVDLDAAKTGVAVNRDVIAAIANAVNIKVQVGGGVRDRASAEALLATGASRVVIGTMAVRDPALVTALASAFPRQIAIGLDTRHGVVSTAGWREGTQQSAVGLLRLYESSGIDTFIATDIERDGMMEGPDLDGISSLLGATNAEIIASGGVGSLEDLTALANLTVDNKRVSGVIVGKSLYENRFSVEDAIRACEASQ